MGVIAISFLVASLAVLGLAFAAWRSDRHRFDDLFACATMLLSTWTISNVLTEFYTPPDSLLFYPIMDAVAGSAVAWAWFSKPARWKFVLAALFLLECVLHVAFWLHREKPYSILYTYTLGLNVIFALQLLTVGWPGGAHVVARVGGLYRGPARFDLGDPVRLRPQ